MFPRTRATGKTGGIWGKGEDPPTQAFLELCKKHRAQFRFRCVKDEVFQKISDELFYGPGFDFSKEQCREKMRNLRRSYADAKLGKHQGQAWIHFQDMSFILDEPIEESAGVTESECKCVL